MSGRLKTIKQIAEKTLNFIVEIFDLKMFNHLNSICHEKR